MQRVSVKGRLKRLEAQREEIRKAEPPVIHVTIIHVLDEQSSFGRKGKYLRFFLDEAGYKKAREEEAARHIVIIRHSRDEAYKWMLKEFVIGASVEGHVDRPLGTAHPDYPTMVYPINYGYVDGIMAEDDEEQVVYILGSDKPLTTYKGEIIAVYHRTNDNEDKWIVSLGDRDYADEEILEAIHFQEKYFEGELLR